MLMSPRYGLLLTLYFSARKFYGDATRAALMLLLADIEALCQPCLLPC